MKNLIEIWQVLRGKRIFTSRQETLVKQIVSEAIDLQQEYDRDSKFKRIGFTEKQLTDFMRLKF